MPWTNLKRHPLCLGLLIGWLTGMLWWTGLMIAFGPSAAITHDERGRTVEREITVISRLRFAPLAAIPWAVVGLAVGALTTQIRGPWLATCAGFGAVAGGICSLVLYPWDGWQGILMTLWCLGGALAGAFGGVFAHQLWHSVTE